MSGAVRLPALLACALALGGAAAPPAADEAARQLARGRQVYVESTSPSGGEIVAVLGEGIEVAAAAVPCAGCHGRDGRGRPEGGVTPTDITWSRLARPYGAVAPGGRRHPPYDAASMERALAAGIDPGGTPFHPAMPRYRMSGEDMRDLVAYLQTLGTETDPGVGDGVLRIGVLLPSGAGAGGAGEAVRQALAARVAAFNARGGAWGRTVELRVLERPADEPVLAAITAAGAEDDLGVFAERGVPVLAPFAFQSEPAAVPDRYLFALLPGLDVQARALVRLARESAGAGAPRPAVVAPRGARFDAAVAAAEEAAAGWAALDVRRYAQGAFAPAGLARELAAAGADPVFVLGAGEEAAALLAAAVPLGWRPRLYAAGAAGGALFAAPAGFEGRLFAALPAPPRLGARAAARYRELAAAAPLPAEHLAAQVLALAAADVLLEAVTRAGRDLNRERLVETLEGLRRFETGYLPPLSFGPGRRVGARGAYLARVDLAGRRLEPAAGGWMDLP